MLAIYIDLEAMAVAAATASVLLGGSSLLGSGSSSSICSSSSVGGRLVGNPFVNMVTGTPYRDVLSVNTTYEICIIKRALHRLLLVKMKDSSYPWITFEVNTPDMTDLTTVMQEMENLPWNSESVDNYEGNLHSICVIADSVVERMENYRLLTNNCQHFCNNLLQELGLETYDTTVGPRTTLEPEFNSRSTARGLDNAYSSAIGYAPTIVGRATAAIVGYIVGAPSTVIVATARNREHHTHSQSQ